MSNPSLHSGLDRLGIGLQQHKHDLGWRIIRPKPLSESRMESGAGHHMTSSLRPNFDNALAQTLIPGAPIRIRERHAARQPAPVLRQVVIVRVVEHGSDRVGQQSTHQGLSRAANAHQDDGARRHAAAHFRVATVDMSHRARIKPGSPSPLRRRRRSNGSLDPCVAR